MLVIEHLDGKQDYLRSPGRCAPSPRLRPKHPELGPLPSTGVTRLPWYYLGPPPADRRTGRAQVVPARHLQRPCGDPLFRGD